MGRLLTNFRLPQQTLFFSLAVLAFVVAALKIIFHLKLVVLPIFLLLLGLISYWKNKSKSLYLFFFLLPLINSLPALFIKGYPFNYICVPLFYLAGILLALLLKRDLPDIKSDWLKPYLLLLVVTWLSVLFVLFRWSNLTLKSLAFLKDTPVEPSGVPFSFATIFPVVSLFLFSLSPLIYFLIRRHSLDRDAVMRAVLLGYSYSLIIGVYQWRMDSTFLAHGWWGSRMKQFNGGFSDFNGLGFFSGVLFLYLVVVLVDRVSTDGWQRKYLAEYLFLPMTCLGIFLSGSRTALIFVVVAVVYFFFSKKIRLKYKVIPAILFVFLVVLAGGTLKKRIFINLKGVGQLKTSEDIVTALNRISNGRITMIQNSWQMVTHFPLSGVGAGNFIFYLKFIHFGEKKYLEDLPLNQYLLVLSETGLLGLVFFLLFLTRLLKPPAHFPFGMILWTMVLILLVNNFLWLPEAMILFWIVAALRKGSGKEDLSPVNRNHRWYAALVIFVFVVFNIVHFNTLHPVHMNAIKSTTYTYGLWYPEKDSRGLFNWTKGSSGLFLSRKSSRSFVLSCQAPLQHLSPAKSQEVSVFWRGELVEKIVFNATGDREFELKDKGEGFLEFRIWPTFNLKEMGLGAEGRTLGIQLFHNPARGD